MKTGMVARLKLLTAFLMIAVVAGSLGYGFDAHANAAVSQEAQTNPWMNEGACSYYLSSDATYYYARDCGTGAIVYGGSGNAGNVSGTDAAAILNALNGLATGTSTLAVKVASGNYTLFAGVNVTRLSIVADSAAPTTAPMGVRRGLPTFYYAGAPGGEAFATHPLSGYGGYEPARTFSNFQIVYPASLLTPSSVGLYVALPSNNAFSGLVISTGNPPADRPVNGSVGLWLDGTANATPDTVMDTTTTGGWGNGTVIAANHVTLIADSSNYANCGYALAADSLGSSSGPPYNVYMAGLHEYHVQKYGVCIFSGIHDFTYTGGFNEGSGSTLGNFYIAPKSGAVTGSITNAYSIGTAGIAFGRQRIDDFSPSSVILWMSTQDAGGAAKTPTARFITGTASGGYNDFQGLLATPWASSTVGSGGSLAYPHVSGTTYTIAGFVPLSFTCSGGGTVGITIKDSKGNSYATGLDCKTLPTTFWPVGYKIQVSNTSAISFSVYGGR